MAAQALSWHAKILVRRQAPPPPRLIIEKLRIRIDDPGRVRPTGARGTAAACDLSRRPKDQAFRRAVTIRCGIADDDRPGFAAENTSWGRRLPPAGT